MANSPLKNKLIESARSGLWRSAHCPNSWEMCALSTLPDPSQTEPAALLRQIDMGLLDSIRSVKLLIFRPPPHKVILRLQAAYGQPSINQPKSSTGLKPKPADYDRERASIAPFASLACKRAISVSESALKFSSICCYVFPWYRCQRSGRGAKSSPHILKLCLSPCYSDSVCTPRNTLELLRSRY